MLLRFEYQLLEHPYKNEPASSGELWAEIKINIYDNGKELIKKVLDFQWDIVVFLDWLRNNKDAIMNDRFPLAYSGSSIAETLFLFYEQMDPDKESEVVIENVYLYREHHGIRFALRGTEVDDVYIGLLNQVMTVSYYSGEDQWSYNVQIEDFFNDMERALHILQK